MEKALTRTIEKSVSIKGTDVICMMLSICFAAEAKMADAAFLFLFVAYSYIRHRKEGYISACVMIGILCYNNLVMGYFYSLGFVWLFVCIHLLRWLNQDLYTYLPYLCACIVVPYTYQSYGFSYSLIREALLVYIVLKQACREHCYTKKEYTLPMSIYGTLIVYGALLFIRMFHEQQLLIYCISALILGSICSMDLAFLFILYMTVKLALFTPSFVWILTYLILKNNVWFFTLIGVGYFLIHPNDIANAGLFLFALLMALLSKKEYWPGLQRMKSYEPRLAHATTLQRQIENYAKVFELLANYYEGIHDTSAELLWSMANALQYNATQMENMGSTNLEEAIQKALEGYQYDVVSMDVEEQQEGGLQVCMVIANMKRGEIHTTIKPLLESFLHRKLRVLDVKRKLHIRGYAISLADAIPFQIDPYGDSIKNAYTENGDTFSIFRFRQCIICMISDGMGNGRKAATSSKLITSIFQRMVISGMNQDNAIRCINKLIQSDMYATLDVLCINQLKGVAYLSKSAASPTFLLRNDKIYEITGNALPVGIVSSIEPDCFEIELKDKDEFVMISDGVSKAEIYTWLETRNKGSAKEHVISFHKRIINTRRKDDSTIVDVLVNGE